ncbi:MAG: hypothetical protein KIT84_14860 [Labilithrix sp.]|nr:hypothetical protein [Labilithrix sp.]MCW5812303.1 hypothetical protein [Labilithrix sp.]
MRRALAAATALAACTPFEAEQTTTPEPREAGSTDDAGSTASDGGNTASDGGPSDGGGATGGGLAWEGNDPNGWSISNRDGTSTMDCCGPCVSPCTLVAAATCDDTRIVVDDMLHFNSGPADTRGHRSDGFYAKRTFGPLTVGAKYRVDYKWRHLSAKANGSFGGENTQVAKWTIAVRHEGSNIVQADDAWGLRCQSCGAGPAELAARTLGPFDAPSITVEIVITGSHASTQCPTIVHDVDVAPEYIRFVPL